MSELPKQLKLTQETVRRLTASMADIGCNPYSRVSWCASCQPKPGDE